MQIFKKLLKSKALYVFLALIVQLVFLLLLLTFFSTEFLPVYILLLMLSFVVSVIVVNRDSDTSSKILWVLMISSMPFFGGFLYLLFGGRKIPKALMIQDRQAYSDYKQYALQNKKALAHTDVSRDLVLRKMASMAWHNGCFPLYEKTRTVYFKTGQEQFDALIDALNGAEEYIFIETYILDPGFMLDTILDILERKAAAGVDVRLIYDDFGSILNVDHDFDRVLEARGIKTHAFNRIKPQLAIQMNNRDHRKIIVVDGITAFTGGSNIADEYINRKERFGYWKDMGIQITGAAVEAFTISFLQIWNYSADINTPYEEFILPRTAFETAPANGYVIPFSDSPTDTNNIGKNFHMNMLAGASDFCWISTPYLILDSEMETALTLAVNNGVDVRIVVPGIPDKRMVYEVTRANFKHLLEQGVRIYVYTPGFIHGKVTLADGAQALVGTVNMDFRSYYHNYECGIWMYQTDCLPAIQSDFEDIFRQSQEMTLEQVKSEPTLLRWYRSVLKIFSPLL